MFSRDIFTSRKKKKQEKTLCSVFTFLPTYWDSKMKEHDQNFVNEILTFQLTFWWSATELFIFLVQSKHWN